MSEKFTKLLQRIDSVEKFVNARVKPGSPLIEVRDNLRRLTQTLQTGKLRVNWVSRFPVQRIAMENFINHYPNLLSSYQFKTIPFPQTLEKTQTIQLAQLILQPSVTTGTQPTSYKLSLTEKISLGRGSQCQIKLSECGLVSNYHAEIIPILASGNLQPSWEIQDKSTNGTYVNGEKVLGKKQLKKGDRITLGYHQFSFKSPELIFEFQSSETKVTQLPQYDQLWTNCDLFCLVLNPSQPINDVEQQLIEKVTKTQLFKFVIVWDTSTDNLQFSQRNQENIKRLTELINPQNSNQLSVIQTCLPLQPFYADFYSTSSQTLSRNEDHLFCQVLNNLLNQQAEDILKERIKADFISQVSRIEKFINEQNNKLKTQNQEIVTTGLTPQNIPALKQKINLKSQEINQNKNKIINEIKLSDFPESKQRFIDPQINNSLLHKIQCLVEQELQVKKDGNQLKVELPSATSGFPIRENETLHDYLIRFCQFQVCEWAKLEWQNILWVYAEGGLQTFLQRSQTSLKLVPGYPVNLSSHRNFEVDKLLEDEYVKPTDSPQNPANGGTGRLAMDVVRIAMLGGMSVVGGNPIPLMMGVMNLAGANQAFFQGQKRQQEQQIIALKRELSGHYKAIARSMVEKVSRNITYHLTVTDQALTDTIKKEVERISSDLTQTEQKFKQYQTQLTNLEKDKAELLKILKGESAS
ncbi:FHA domain-containing protein [Planktothrix mougeotii]|uniref:FHA domain-containing protein n=1 Tax=Planktothrix mougeotii LEGE 06226 TaxID=1828728 RepID=A0ABR9UJQ9_9CYAN|nr:FHA domain-containing protein [Planktothrix mougeotii]MBE9146041.1 FHA domain-containing protein [Planktothrix mougeotii LEGE 06226]